VLGKGGSIASVGSSRAAYAAAHADTAALTLFGCEVQTRVSNGLRRRD
jgi:glycerol dehydrogenase-like iron-containing ADH family enzyme